MGIQQFYPLQNVIDYVRKKVHDGQFFSAGHYNSALANNGTLDILIHLNNAYDFHCFASGGIGGNCISAIYENPTFSSAGSALSVTNHNRNSAIVFDGTITHTPTITATGTQISPTTYMPGGDKHSALGGSVNPDVEVILKNGNDYLFRLTNISGSAAAVSLHVEGYQER